MGEKVLTSVATPPTKMRICRGPRGGRGSNEIEFYGAYYNKGMFEELGLAVPTTYDEFLAVCEALKQAGKIPIAYANQGGWPAYHLFSVWANNFAGKAKMDELLFGDGSWNDPAIVAAIQAFFVDLNQRAT